MDGMVMKIVGIVMKQNKWRGTLCINYHALIHEFVAIIEHTFSISLDTKTLQLLTSIILIQVPNKCIKLSSIGICKRCVEKLIVREVK